MKKIILFLLPYLFMIAILALSVRGIAGNPTQNELDNPSLKEDGPCELSPERGRFALLYSIVENNSFTFDVPIARFATPDLGTIHGNFVSLFAPGVSFVVIPGYLVGKIFGISQV